MLLTPADWVGKVVRDFYSAIQLTSRPLPLVRLNCTWLRLPHPVDLTSSPVRHLPSDTAVHLTRHCPLPKQQTKATIPERLQPQATLPVRQLSLQP